MLYERLKSANGISISDLASEFEASAKTQPSAKITKSLKKPPNRKPKPKPKHKSNPNKPNQTQPNQTQKSQNNPKQSPPKLH